jgi:hypothetical protein
MDLGTEESIVSIALVSIPPGNIVRHIAELRGNVWKTAGLVSARAWFDFPVFAWLACPLEGSVLAGAASRCALPFKLETLECRDNNLYLRFSEELELWAHEIPDRFPIADKTTEFKPGPFTSGIGCYCASFADASEIPDSYCSTMGVTPFSAKTHLLAQIEFSWKPGPGMESSWATLSAARFGRHNHEDITPRT